MRKRIRFRTGCAALSAAMLILSAACPLPAFADQAPDLLSGQVIQEKEGAEGTAAMKSTNAGGTEAAEQIEMPVEGPAQDTGSEGAEGAEVTPEVTQDTEETELHFTVEKDGAKEDDRKFKAKITFESYDDADTGFNELTESVMIGDTKFVLNSIDGLKMTDARTPERRTMDFTTETFIKGDENGYLPAESMKKGGILWKLTEKELIDSEIEDRVKEAVATKRYVGVETGVPVPDSVEYTYTDEDTGESINEMLPLTDQTEGAWYWIPFEFPITISGYGAESLDLNGTEIRADEPLSDHANEFLDMLGLSGEYYRVNSVDWDGEPYEHGGETYRNAIGTGEKYVRDIDAVYSAEVTLPHQDGAAWKCLYTEELDDSHKTVYTYEAEAVYISTAEQTPFGRIMGVISAFYHSVIEAVMEHPVLAAIQLVLLAAFITFLVSKRKKKCLYDSSRACVYKRDCTNCPYYTAISKEYGDHEQK